MKQFTLLLCSLGLVVFVLQTHTSAQDQSTEDAENQKEFAIPLANVFGVLQNRKVVKELEVLEDQLAEIQEFANNYKQAVEKPRRATKALPARDAVESDESMKEHQQAMAKAKANLEKEFTGKLDEVLVPAQRTRLRQITVQLMFANPNFFSTYQEEKVARRVKLSEKEEKQLREAAKQVEADFLKELRELKLKHHEEVRESLGMDVRDRIQQILGDPYIETRPKKRRR